MDSQISLKSVAAAIMLFAVTLAMHEASRADRLLPQGTAPLAATLLDWSELLRAAW